MIRPASLGFTLVVLLLTGCVFVRPQADTVLQLTPSNASGEALKLGMRKVVGVVVDGEFIIVGRGWHPREHETYAFFMNEALPDVLTRWIRIRPSKNQDKERTYLLDLWVINRLARRLGDIPQDGRLFCHYHGEFDSISSKSTSPYSFHLSRIRLFASEGHAAPIYLSGRVDAERVSAEALEKMLNRLNHEVDQRVESQPIDH